MAHNGSFLFYFRFFEHLNMIRVIQSMFYFHFSCLRKSLQQTNCFIFYIHQYEIYPKMAQNCCDRKKSHFEVQTPKWLKTKGKKFWAILGFECVSNHVVLSLSQQFWAILGSISYYKVCSFIILRKLPSQRVS